RAVTQDAESPEAHTLVGAVASAEGDVDAALEAFERAMELDDEYLDPVLLAAETYALEGDAKEALRLCERALDIAEEEDEYVDAILLKAEIELGDGDVDAAGKTLGELPPVALPTAALELRAGDAFLEIDDPDRAVEHYERAAKKEPANADAEYGLGLVAEARGEQAAMVAHFQRVRMLDGKAPPLPWAVTEDRMEELVEAALAELPERAQKLLENVPVMVEALPSEEVVGDGFDPRGLGLFAGVPFPEQSTLGGPPHLDAVFLYQRNIERVARSMSEVESEIRTTLLHETGHFFGLDEEDLAEMGLD
ncbi:MAG TPA: metallopeptidase family protein, partial [Polyangia bacterium]|nr:metallopeptidase family protein [Polyangia bacterium]